MVKVGATGLGFLTTLTLARLLKAEGYGAYSYALAWVNLLVILGQCGFEKLLTREVAVYHSDQRWALLNGLLRATNSISLGISLAVAGVAVAMVWVLRERLDPSLVVPFLVSLSLIPVLSLTTLRRSAMAGLHRVASGQVPEMLLRPVFLLAGLLTLHFVVNWRLDATTAMVCNIGAAIAAFGVGMLVLSRALPSEVRRSSPRYDLRPWLKSALPLALLGGLQMLNYRIDSLMLGAIQGAGPVGVYNVVFQIVALINFITLAADGATAPRFAGFVGKGDTSGMQRLFTLSTRTVFGLTLPSVILVILMGEWILGIFGDEFRVGYSALTILALGRLMPAAIGPVGVALTMARLERLAVTSVVAALLLKLVLNLVLIPRMGVSGAALSTALVSACWFAVNGVVVYRKLGVVPTVAARAGSGRRDSSGPEDGR